MVESAIPAGKLEDKKMKNSTLNLKFADLAFVGLGKNQKKWISDALSRFGWLYNTEPGESSLGITSTRYYPFGAENPNPKWISYLQSVENNLVAQFEGVVEKKDAKKFLDAVVSATDEAKARMVEIHNA